MDPLSHYESPDQLPETEPMCRNCGIQPPAQGRNQLCSSCREQFIKYPIPKWIWLFAASILVVMIIGFTRMGSFMSHSIHLAKAEKAIEQHRYLTAQRELKGLLARFPDKLEVKADMLIAAAYNRDGELVKSMYEKLKTASFEDQTVLDRIGDALRYFSAGNIDSTLGARISSLEKDSAALQKMAPQIDTIAEPSDRAAAYLYVASFIYNFGRYDVCNALTDTVLREDPANCAALSMKAAALRQLGYVDNAVALLKRLLDINREDVTVMAQLCRTELKGHHDKEAAAWLKQASAIEPDNISVLEARSMVEFYSGQKEKSLQTFAKVRQAEQSTGDTSITVRLNKILSGTEKFR